MNVHAVRAIYRFEMARTFRTLLESILSPVLSTSLYFIVFGGILGQTVGEYVAGTPVVPPPAKLTLHVVAMRTRNAIIRDWSFVARLGEWLGRTTAAHWHWPPSSAFAAIAGFARHQSREDE